MQEALPDFKQLSQILSSDESTLVAHFTPSEKKNTAYQSEAELEKTFIAQLQAQKYEYLQNLRQESDLIQNLRTQLERLNHFTFSDEEWPSFFYNYLAKSNSNIADKTKLLQAKNTAIAFTKKDGTIQNIHLIDKDNLHSNHLQVINQYETKGAKRSFRYDVTILLNGFPVVHVELKKRSTKLKEAFNQINRYQRESFWENSGLFQYVQLFVISNGTLTKYYSNTVRNSAIEERQNPAAAKGKGANSFAFTSYWADFHNKQIHDLEDFTSTFFAKHTLLNLLAKYCVFDSNERLLAMRPYQIAATEQILSRIKTATLSPRSSNVKTGGYIWHTTGSGKTLTSFKTAQIASGMPEIDKVLFIVDRKDLDSQTIEEYERFQKGAASSSTSTKALKKQLEDHSCRIIVTTIQKLSRFIKLNKTHEATHKKTVLIFDECHRSQFGDMHRDITKFFKNHYLFGFTGTPILLANKHKGSGPSLQTTQQIFGDRLHTYTIIDAIADKNVLPFNVAYHSTVKSDYEGEEQVSGIDTDSVLLAPERITQVTEYIRTHFARKTSRNTRKNVFQFDNKRRIGFNALFATASIEAAKAYYAEFKRQQKDLPEKDRLKIGLIYSFAPNEEISEGQTDSNVDEENSDSASQLDQSSRDFLDKAIEDYNHLFKMNFDSGDKFSAYYKDLSKNLKNGNLDLVIVVNMFLTGFDAPALNTLWVDKNLKHHGLIQAFSRTNRILNDLKHHGNIVCFRKLEKATNEALALFGNKEAAEIVLLKSYAHYFEEYKKKVEDLLSQFPLSASIVGESRKKAFISLFGEILKFRNILNSFDEFEGNQLLQERILQDYQSRYLDLYEELKKPREDEKEDIHDDVIFEIELIKQVEINIDYILKLVEDYLKENKQSKEEIYEKIERSIASAPSLRNKKDLIEEFIQTVSENTLGIDGNWQNYITRKKQEELNRIIQEENLNPEKTQRLIQDAFNAGGIPVSGTAIRDILPKLSLFSENSVLPETKQRVIDKLSAFYDRYADIL